MEEIEEVERLIETATFPGVKAHLQSYLNKLKAKSTASASAAAPVATSANASVAAKETSAVSRPLSFGGVYIPVENFSWDQGSYNSPTVTVYVEIPNVGSVKDNVTVDFGTHSFDFKVHGCDGKNYRLIKDNLDKDIVPHESKFIVKKDKVVIKLQKVKGEYSYESWTSLTAKKPRDATKDEQKKKDPMGGLMDMMKDMYEDGDDNMKKIIGEAMLKSKSGERPDPPSMPGMGDI
jgi:calcyclin binding protein